MPEKQDISKGDDQKEVPLTFILSQPGPATSKDKSAIYSHVARVGHQQRRQRRAEAQQEESSSSELSRSSILPSPSHTNVAKLSFVPNSLEKKSAIYSHVAKRAHLERRQQYLKQEQASQEYKSKSMPLPFPRASMTRPFESSIPVRKAAQPVEDADVEEVYRTSDKGEQPSNIQGFQYGTLTNDMVISSGSQFGGLLIKPQRYFGPVIQFWQANVSPTLAPNTYPITHSFQSEMLSHVYMTTALAGYLSIEPLARNAMLYHRGETLRLLSESITSNQKDGALSDFNILTITGLIFTDVKLHLHAEAISHLHGLRRIVALRGGLSRIGVDGRLKAIFLICEHMVDQMCSNGSTIEHTPSERSNPYGSQQAFPNLVDDNVGTSYSRQVRLLPASEGFPGSTEPRGSDDGIVEFGH